MTPDPNLAEEGVDAMVGRNGDLFMIRPVPGIRRQVTETGRLGRGKNKLVRVG